MNIYHQRLNPKCIAKAKIYNFVPCILPILDHKQRYTTFFFQSPGRGVRFCFEFSSRPGDIRAVDRFSRCHWIQNFNRWIFGWAIDVGKRDVIGFSMCPTPPKSSKCSLSLSWFPFFLGGFFSFFPKIGFLICLCILFLLYVFCLFDLFGFFVVDYICKSRIWGL